MSASVKSLGRALRTAASLWKYRARLWLPSYRSQQRRLRQQGWPPAGPVDVMVLVTDHYEPSRREGERGVERVREWCERYAEIARRHRDSDGRPPQHSWFYRYDYPNFDCIRILSEYCYHGYGEVEFHLHHHNDTPDNFRRTLNEGVDWFSQAGAMISAEPRPRSYFAYIAGNWALDNGRHDDRFSGVNNELEILRASGCYADFTFPAFGCDAQPRMANRIYYAKDTPAPKSYDRGVEVRVGGSPSGDLMLIQGPLYVDWAGGYTEYASFEAFTPYFPQRLEYWWRAGVHVQGRPEWLFIKLHTHAMQSRETFLSDQLDQLCADLEDRFGGDGYRLHYVTAREAYNIVKAAEAGERGDAGCYRDYLLPPPANRLLHCNVPYRLKHYSAERVELEIPEPAAAVDVWLKEGPVERVRGGVLRRFELARSGDQLDALRIAGEGQVEVSYRHGASEVRELPLVLEPPDQRLVRHS